MTATTEKPLTPLYARLRAGLWIAVVLAIMVWVRFDPPGWDAGVYQAAIKALKAGHDPYADAIAIQKVYHDQRLVDPNADPPYSYVYSPLTLPVLRLIGMFPVLLVGIVYWALYAVAAVLQTWAAMQATEERERPYISLLQPVFLFFPGLLANGILLSGNIAYILYAAVLCLAIVGWRKGTWVWFYIAVVLASCVKAPLLCLVLIPVLSARGQWLKAGAAFVVACVLFAMQPYVWPSLFRNYLQAVELQFSYNRDFGCSPAGLFSGFLYDHGIPYSPGTYLFFLGYALPLLGMLVYLSRQYFAGRFTLRQWVPVLLVGVVMLNPRLIEYDVAPLAIPLTLIVWRVLVWMRASKGLVAGVCGLMLVANGLGIYSWNVRKLIDGPLLSVVFVAGCWMLLKSERADVDAQSI